ncbi:MAG: hypothetical protein U0P30_02550 [Vicinamibacterales bacterium]
MTRTCSMLGAAAVVALATSAAAQPAASPTPQEQLRHQIYLMEGVLSRAVTSGAARLNAQFRAVMPDLVVVAGESNARGFNLEGYGVFFDVEVPVLRQSMMWSLRTMLDQDTQGASDALASLRGLVNSTTGQERVMAENALRRLELQLRPFGVPTQAPGAAPTQGVQAASMSGFGAPTAAPGPPAAPRPPINAVLLQDPNKAYTDAVVKALIEAIVDNALPMVSVLDPEAYLTVAARDNERRDVLDPYEEVSTFTLRIKAADLAAYRGGKIDREEAKKRVQVQVF